MNRTRSSWSAAVIAALTLCAFARTFENGFVNYDDDRAIVHNPYLAGATHGRFGWMWSTFHLGHYQPLAWLSLAIDHALGSADPFVYHADSVLWHAAAAALLFVLLIDLAALADGGKADPRRALSAAMLAALFWSLHPLRVESVAWATERRDPISAVFLLLAAIAYLRSVSSLRTSGGRRRRGWYLASCVLLLLSLLAKAWGMTFFVVLLAVDVYPLRRLPLAWASVSDRRYRHVWLEKVPFATLGAAAGAVAWLAQRSQPDAMVPVAEWSIGSRVLQAAYGLCFYAGRTVWPASLAVVYPLPAGGGVPAAWIASAGAVLAAAAAIAATARRWPGLAAGTVAYAAIVSPVLGLAQSGPQAVADRYTYVSAIPFSALAAGALGVLPDRLWRKASIVSVTVLAALVALTWKQATVWHDSIALWSHTLGEGYESALAHVDYGQALRAGGRLEPAIAEYRKALALRPDDGSAWYNLANSLKAARDTGGAESAYKQAIAHLPRALEAHVNLGNLYFNERRLPEAIAEYRAATAETADTPAELIAPEPFLYLGMALADHGDTAAAREPLAIARRYASTRARAERELRRLEGKD